MALLPERPASVILINNREIKEASPVRLTRRNRNAAILEFTAPRKSFLSAKDIEKEIRQGSIVECYYGLGTAQQRIFYGYLPSTLSNRTLSEKDSLIHFTAQDFIGQLADRTMTLGDSTSSFLNPIGDEIGAFIARLAQTVIDSQIGTAPAFSIQGIQGTNPAQFISESNANLGSATAKAFVDKFTQLAYDDSAYPNAPLLYEYHQRDQYFIWRKEKSLVSGNPVMRLTVGQDAVLSGTIQTKPLYTDAYASGKTTDAAWTHSDRDSARRWGGRRFWSNLATTSSFQSDSYDVAVRQVELYKNERRSFSLLVSRDPFLLYPGDIIALDNAPANGLPDGKHRVQEVVVDMSPTLRTSVTVGDLPKLLTSYL